MKLDAFINYMKMRIFLIPLAITFLNPKILLGSLFSTKKKNSLTWEAKFEN